MVHPDRGIATVALMNGRGVRPDIAVDAGWTRHPMEADSHLRLASEALR